jgi:hypothetical protein
MTFGSGPVSGLLAAYRSCQPPRAANRAAMPGNASPGCMTYLAVEFVAVMNGALAFSVLVRVISSLFAMRMFAWAGQTDPFMPAAARMSRMLQASMTHADLAS